MKKQFLICLLGLYFPFLLTAQLFSNATSLLPANGTKNANMDVQVADIDKDGDIDIILACEFQPNTILINDGKGNFTKGGSLPQPIKDSEDVAIADFNGDGNLDVVFCSEDDITLARTNVHEYYFGNGKGDFSDSGIRLPDSEANAVITQDINKDGKPDLIFGNKGTLTILINDGQGNFKEENNRVPQIQRVTQDVAMADVDGDNDLDILLGNEDGNLLFINRGNGFFDDSTATLLPTLPAIETRKVSFGDIDKDGDVDVFLSNVAFRQDRDPRDRLLVNNGKGKFTDVTSAQMPIDSDHTLDAIFEDLDNDGHLDLVVATAFGGRLKTFKNDGKGVFTENTMQTLGGLFVIEGLGVIAADFDGDGLRDLYFCNRMIPQRPNTQDLLFMRKKAIPVQPKR